MRKMQEETHTPTTTTTLVFDLVSEPDWTFVTD